MLAASLGMSSWCVTCLTMPHGLLLVWMGQKKRRCKHRRKKKKWERKKEKRKKGKTLLALLYDHKICMYDIGISICSYYYTTTHKHPCRANERPCPAPGLGTGDAPQRTKRIRRPAAAATDHTELLLGFLAADAHAGTPRAL